MFLDWVWLYLIQVVCCRGKFYNCVNLVCVELMILDLLDDFKMFCVVLNVVLVIVLFDGDCLLLMVNEKFSVLIGFVNVEVVGCNCWFL